MPRRAPEAGHEQDRDTVRIFSEGDCCPYFQRPVTLAFPRVLELQRKQGPIRSGTQARAAGLHREEAEGVMPRVERGSLELPPEAEWGSSLGLEGVLWSPALYSPLSSEHGGAQGGSSMCPEGEAGGVGARALRGAVGWLEHREGGGKAG